MRVPFPVHQPDAVTVWLDARDAVLSQLKRPSFLCHAQPICANFRGPAGADVAVTMGLSVTTHSGYWVSRAI